MQEHPVPQNVTGYEFHLIGRMTLKQFFTCGVGVVLAVITNATNLPGIFKYPMMFLFGVGGFALAFVPFEGRSLDIWFFSFLRSIYKPTLFFWKKTNPVPEAFTYIQPRFLDLTPTVNYSGIRTQRAQEFLETIPSSAAKPSLVPEEDVESVLALFTERQPTGAKPLTARPSVQPSIPVFQKSTKEVIIKPAGEIKIEPQAVAPLAPAKPVFVPPTQEITSAAKPMEAAAKPVETSSALPFPKPPTERNMIVGMTLTGDSPPKILDGAIVEIIRRSDGTPVRALKTNALGQFAIVTRLDDGEYEINVEKEGYNFDKTSLVLNNQVVEPLLIQAKK